jgi:hypothetical protein
MNWSVTCAAGIAHRFEAIRTNAAIWWRFGRPRFRPTIRRQHGGRASVTAAAQSGGYCSGGILLRDRESLQSPHRPEPGALRRSLKAQHPFVPSLAGQTVGGLVRFRRLFCSSANRSAVNGFSRFSAHRSSKREALGCANRPISWANQPCDLQYVVGVDNVGLLIEVTLYGRTGGYDQSVSSRS